MCPDNHNWERNRYTLHVKKSALFRSMCSANAGFYSKNFIALTSHFLLPVEQEVVYVPPLWREVCLVNEKANCLLREFDSHPAAANISPSKSMFLHAHFGWTAVLSPDRELTFAHFIWKFEQQTFFFWTFYGQTVLPTCFQPFAFFVMVSADVFAPR